MSSTCPLFKNYVKCVECHKKNYVKCVECHKKNYVKCAKGPKKNLAMPAGSEEKEAGGKKPGHKESSEEKGAAIKKGRKDI